MKCPNCGYINDARAAECARCGCALVPETVRMEDGPTAYYRRGAEEERTRENAARRSPGREMDGRRRMQGAGTYAGLAKDESGIESRDSIYSLQKRKRRRRIARAVARIVLALVLLCAVGVGIYLLYPYVSGLVGGGEAGEQNNAPTMPEVTYEVTSVEKNGRSAHEVVFRSAVYDSLYIPELKKTYLFNAGEASVMIYDETVIGDKPTSARIDVVLTPVYYTTAGFRVDGASISYMLGVEQTGVELVAPAAEFSEVQSSLTTIQFRVPTGSTVYVQDEDVSDFADTTGLISLSVDTSITGENHIVIRAQAQGKLETMFTLTLYRPYQDILIELDANQQYSSSSKTVTISGKTLKGATVSVDSPSGSSVVSRDGTFSVTANLDVFGDNTITLRAAMEGKEDTLYTFMIYYAPALDEYSKQAWPLDKANYAEILGSPATRVGKIYVGRGVVTSATEGDDPVYTFRISDTLEVLMDMVDGKELETGKSYKIYCDFSTMSDGVGLFIGRYYYKLD